MNHFVSHILKMTIRRTHEIRFSIQTLVTKLIIYTKIVNVVTDSESKNESFANGFKFICTEPVWFVVIFFRISQFFKTNIIGPNNLPVKRFTL